MGKYDTDVHYLRKQIEELDTFIKRSDKKNTKGAKAEPTEKEAKIMKKYNSKYKDHMCKNCKYLDKFNKLKDKFNEENNESQQIIKKKDNKKSKDIKEIKDIKCVCGFRECKDGAHNPNQLNLVKPKKDKKLMINNLNNVIAQKKQSTSSTPWSYARQGFIQPGPSFSRSIINQYGKEYRRTKSAKRINEREIKNQIIRAYEV